MKTIILAILTFIFGMAFSAVTDFTELYALSTTLAVMTIGCGICLFGALLGQGVNWMDDN